MRPPPFGPLPPNPAPPPKPCTHCGLTVAGGWKFCPYCEQRADVAPAPDWRPSESIRARILERQLIESLPEMHAEAWRAMGPIEKLLWLRYWQPQHPIGVSFRLVPVCRVCGRDLLEGGCVECGTGRPPARAVKPESDWFT